jgi:hydroxymethylpyrimidine pyrophosphatase-like HAD family hydrolase
MNYLALATDYDATLAALTRLRQSGRRLVLVTGRELPDLQLTFANVDLFDRVVAENGALLYRPATREERVLATPPPQTFRDELARRRVRPLAAGRVILATWEPHRATVLDVIRGSGLDLRVILNKGAVMVLPTGVDKATGLAAALEELGLPPHATVGVGDAENDHSLLAYCGCGVAVANALVALKERADWVTAGDHGAGVAELAERLLADDLAGLALKRTRS